MKVKLFARGLHELLGIHWSDGWLYATQRCEVTRIKDEDGDGRADVFETLPTAGASTVITTSTPLGRNLILKATCGWSCVQFLQQQHPHRGWCVRVNKKGEMIPTASGIRSPAALV